jgi:hypothetical protein
MEPLDLGPGPHQLVEMLTETMQIHIEMSGEAIEVRLRATIVSGPFLLVQGAEHHQAHFPLPPMEEFTPREIGRLPEVRMIMLNRFPLNQTLLD